MSGGSRRDRTRPAELLGISAVIALGVGFVVFFAVRDLATAGVWLGISFIVVVVVMAMLVLAADPQAGRRRDDDESRGH